MNSLGSDKGQGVGIWSRLQVCGDSSIAVRSLSNHIEPPDWTSIAIFHQITSSCSDFYSLEYNQIPITENFVADALEKWARLSESSGVCNPSWGGLIICHLMN